MDIISLATLLSGVGACASAAATLRTVYEMKKQRESSYKPDIFISKFSIQGKESIPFLKNKKLNVPIINLGLGSAKNIRVFFSDNIEEYIQNINILLNDLKIGFMIYKDTALHLDSKSSNGESSQSISISNTILLNYIQNGDKNILQVPIPSYFINFVDMLLKVAFKHNSQKLKQYIQYIFLYVDITYSDIGEKQYHKKQVFRFVDCVFDYNTSSYTARYL